MTDLEQVAGVMFAALAAGVLILAMASLLPAVGSRARGLWHLMGTEALIIAVAGSVFLAGTLVVQVAVVLTAGRIGFESAAVGLSRTSCSRARLEGMGIALAAAVAAMTFMPLPWNIALAAGAMLVMFACAHLKQQSHGIASTVRTVLFPGIPLCALALAVRDRQLYVPLLVAFLLTELFDSFAVLGGRLFGRFKIFPRLSPRKTLEGLLTGILALAFAALVLPSVALPSSTLRLIAPFAIAAAAVSGDLLASSAKRTAGVKDFPPIMEEQGGLLDILDAWLLSGPVLAVLWLLIR